MSDKLGIVNKPPYFDDFDSKKNYSKILFRPGRAIQSRELTQIQTLLQNQISSIGDKFINSPVVSGCDFRIGEVKFLKFRSEEDVSYLKGKLGQLSSGSNVCKFKIVEVKQITDNFSNAEISTYNNWVIFFDYTNGFELTDVSSLSSSPVADQQLLVTIIDEAEAEQTLFTFNILGIGADAYSVLDAQHKNTTTGILSYGDALLARLGTGILYKKGYFIVNSEPLVLPISTTLTTNSDCIYTNYAPSIQNTKILLKLVSSFITTEEDPTLYDPSAGFYNFAAPGADRLKITPSLVQSIDETDLDAIDLATIVDGETRIDAGVANDFPLSILETDKDCQDQILKPFILDIIGTTLYVNSGRAVVNCTDIEIIENQAVSISTSADPKRLFNQPLNQQCLSDAIIVQSNPDTPLFGGVSGYDYSSVNTNYYGSGKIKKLFSDEAVRLEIVNCDGIKIGCLTLLDISKNDATSYRLHYNELQSYVSTIPESSLFAEACTLSLDGEKVFTIESTIPLTCSDTLQGANRRLVYRIPKGSNIKNVFDSDYMITRDFVSDITTKSVRGLGVSTTTGTVAEFSMDIPNGVFNDGQVGEEAIIGDPDLFTVIVNGKVIPLKQQRNAPYVLIESKSKVTVVLDRLDEQATSEDGELLTVPTAGKCYLIAKVRFPEKASSRASAGVSDDPIPHRKKILKEARGSYIHNFAVNSTLSLGFSDIYKLKSIKDGSGTDLTSKFVFDDGQRNDRYDHGSITIDPNERTSVIGSDSSSSREYIVEFQYFEHIPIAPGFYGPITVNSYGFNKNGDEISAFHGLDLNGNQLTLSYDEIPNFLDRVSGEVISLSDAIDYRLVRTEEGLIENGVNKSSILRGRWFPSPDSSAAVETSYSLDLPRIDLLVLREDGTMSVLTGEPAAVPMAREYPKDGCVIAEIRVPGRILSSEDFIVNKTPIKSVTLSELNDMQNRLAEIEKSLSLKTLENKARAQSASLQNEYLTGMVVDDFGGHYVGDVSNDEYNCSMDFSKGVLRSPFTTSFFDFVPNSGYPLSGNTAYYGLAPENTTGVTLISNDQGTNEVSVNGFGVTDWHGYLSIDRPYHLWIDQTTKPVVRNNSRGQNDAWESGGECVQPNGRNKGFGTQWAFWKSLWFGDSIFDEVAIEKDRASSKGFSDSITNIAPSRFSRSINKESLFANHKKTISSGGFALTDPKSSKYVDSALSFFSPENYILVRGYSLKPNTVFSVYFDNLITPVSSSRIYSKSLASLSEVKSNSNGYVEFVLRIPAASYITGNKVVKIIESASTTKPSYASAIYQNIGSEWKNKIATQDDSVETEILPIGRSDIFVQNEKTLYSDSSNINGIYQTFFIDKQEYPQGLILDYASVYFSQVDTTIPVSIEIRKLINGKVDIHNIIKNSRVEISPSSSGYNEFEFVEPVFLAAGDYALVIKSNSNNYKVHISQRGVTRVDNGVVNSEEAVFASSPYGVGSFFSGSAFGQQGDNSTTLRFSMHRKSFRTTQNSFTLKPRLPLIGGVDSEAKLDLVYLANNNWQTTTGSVVYELNTANGRRKISSNTDIEESDTFRTDTSRLIVGIQTTREDVSPIVDFRKIGLLTIKNQISSTTDVGEDKETLSFGGSLGSKMKYITRRTDLDLPANVLRATVEAKLPADFELKLYAKVLYEGEQDFDNKPYKAMSRVFGASTSTKDKFKELVFELDETDNYKNFVSFSVKIVLLSNLTDTSTQAIEFYPELRNFTVVSTVR